MSDYPHGTLVEWDWGAGSAKGKVDKVHRGSHSDDQR